MIEDYIQHLDETLLTTFGNYNMNCKLKDTVVVKSNSMGAGVQLGDIGIKLFEDGKISQNSRKSG